MDSAVNVLAGSRTHHVPITERVAPCCDERRIVPMSEKQKEYPSCVFSFSLSFTDKRRKQEISHTAEMRTLEEHNVGDFMVYAERFLNYFKGKYEAGEFERKKGITLIEGNLEKFGIDGDGLHEFVREY